MICPENIICGLYSGGDYGYMEVTPPRLVERFELELYLEDGFTTTVNDTTYQVKKNYMQIAKPGQIRYSVMPFKTAYLKFTAEGELADMLISTPDYFCSSHPGMINTIMNEIILLSDGNNALLLNSRILALINLVLIDSKIPDAQSGKNYEIISTAKRYIEEHFREAIRLHDISSSVYLSDIYFHNIFTSAMGITPHQYLINCRMEYAKRLLWNPSINIDDIAQSCGFGCRQYFNKVFKSETGMTPVLYRKSLQQNY